MNHENNIPQKLIRLIGLAHVLLGILLFLTSISEDPGPFPIVIGSITLYLLFRLLFPLSYQRTMLIIFSSMLLILGWTLQSSLLFWNIFLLFDLGYLVFCLIQIHQPVGTLHALGSMLKPIIRMLLQTIPVLLAVFFLFPKYFGNLWEMETKVARSGFSNTLQPGSVSRLVKSHKTVFRARVEDFTLNSSSLYWRGSMLNFTKGMNWSFVKSKTEKVFTNSLKPIFAIKQLIFLEPLYKNNLFALDTPIGIDSDNFKTLPLSANIFVSSKKANNQRTFYQAFSHKLPKGIPLTKEESEENLQLPPDLSKAVWALIKDLNREGRTNREKAETILNYFKNQDFRYSLELEYWGHIGIDKFLFKTKVGFCEHFSSAFGILARGMGVPTRIVTGFQGGEFNPFTGFYTITNADAHAWNEIWDEQINSWIRIDPTATIEPERIAIGGQQFHNFLAGTIIARLIDWAGFKINTALYKLVRLISALGHDIKDVYGTLLFTALVIFIMILVKVINARPKQLAHQVFYHQYVEKISKMGIAKTASMGPRTLEHKIKQANVPHFHLHQEFIAIYIEMQYGQLKIGSAPHLKRLKSILRKIK